MADNDKEMCRKAAVECIELARVTTDPIKKEVLLTRAQEWLKLAYSNSDAEFEQHLGQTQQQPNDPGAHDNAAATDAATAGQGKARGRGQGSLTARGDRI